MYRSPCVRLATSGLRRTGHIRSSYRVSKKCMRILVFGFLESVYLEGLEAGGTINTHRKEHICREFRWTQPLGMYSLNRAVNGCNSVTGLAWGVWYRCGGLHAEMLVRP